MKKVLIISPYFAPVNAADMQRVRMSLPYFDQFGWEAEVVAIHERYADMTIDPFLSESIPSHVKVHKVKAIAKKWTSKFGLGSIALRSLWFYKKKVDQLLTTGKFDLIYFSTTQFPVLALGPYWKQKFNIPFVADIQDPWHSEYYQDKPKNQRPKKYWFSYRLNKYLEKIAIPAANGLIAVSEAYIKTLKTRYPQIKDIPASTITFGAFKKDLEIAEQHKRTLKVRFPQHHGLINLIYIGRAGSDMQAALKLLFEAFKAGLQTNNEDYKKLRLHFIGTSYAPDGKGIQTVMPVAAQFGLETYITEQTDRITYYENLYNLSIADGLVVPGSDDPTYTASKIYPYILVKKPLLAIFNPQSSTYKIIQECHSGINADLTDPAAAIKSITTFLDDMANGKLTAPETDWEKFNKYSAKEMTKAQCALFNKVVNERN